MYDKTHGAMPGKVAPKSDGNQDDGNTGAMTIGGRIKQAAIRLAAWLAVVLRGLV